MWQRPPVTPLSGKNGSYGFGSNSGRTADARPFFRADLHVHSRYSGSGHLHGPGLSAGVGDPEILYRVARARGMDLVTFTDIDTIDGCLDLLNRHPDIEDFVISEEIVVTEPHTGRSVHVLLYDISEAQHREAQRLKGNVRELMAYVRCEGIVASLSPSLRGLPADAWASADMEELLALFERFEVKNGTLSRSHNKLAARLVQELAGGRRLGVTAGSNAHGPARIGRTVTVSPARSAREFLRDLKGNRTWASGKDGSMWDDSADLSRLIAEQYRVLLRRVKHRPVARGLARALLAVPLHLLGSSYFNHGLRRVRVDSRARQTWRHLDRIEVRRFQARSKSWAPAASAVGAEIEPVTQRRPITSSARSQHS
jgi:predicted metal-dependent phosphoesterase TrpH